MLHKMYLVSSKHFKEIKAPKKTASKIKRKLPQIDYKWIKLSGKLREVDVTRKAQLKDIPKFMKQVLLEPPVKRFGRITPPVKRRESLPTAPDKIAPKKPKLWIEDSDLDSENFGEIASPYLKPYQYNVRFLEK